MQSEWWKTLSRWGVAAVALALVLGACDDGGGNSGPETEVADTADSEEVAETLDLEDLGEVPADVPSELDAVDTVEVADLFEVFTDPVVFHLVRMDSELREIIYMRGGGAIALPQVKLRAETIAREPIPGQEVAFFFPFPGSRATPSTSWTDAAGLTEELALYLTGDTDGATARFLFTPFFIGTEPAPMGQRAVEATGVFVDVVLPVDDEGVVLPLVGDGVSDYPLAVEVRRTDNQPLTIDLALELEIVQSGGTAPVAFVDHEALVRRVPVPREGTESSARVDFPLRSTAAGSDTAVLILRLLQRDSSRGQRMEILPVVDPE